jgi:RND family efflux transporter MFP subunit
MHPPPVARSPHAWRALAPVGLVTLAAGVAACGDARAADAPPADRTGAVAPIPVRVAPAAVVSEAEQVRAGGVVEARATAELAFQAGGRVVTVAADEGAHVARGALLAVVDPTDYRLALRQAALQLARAEDELGRAEQLRAAASITPNDYDRLLTGARQARVARDLAAKRLADTRLTAPFRGVVARKGTEVGATAPRAPPCSPSSTSTWCACAPPCPRPTSAGLRAGQPAEVTLEALADSAPARGRVTAVGVAADPASRTYSVQIEVPNASHRLRAGMVASARRHRHRARRRRGARGAWPATPTAPPSSTCSTGRPGARGPGA